MIDSSKASDSAVLAAARDYIERASANGTVLLTAPTLAATIQTIAGRRWQGRSDLVVSYDTTSKTLSVTVGRTTTVIAVIAARLADESAGAALQRVIDRSAEHNALGVIPAGDWSVQHYPGVQLRSGARLLFQPGAKLRREGVCNAVLWGSGIENFSIEGVDIDIRADVDFRSAISLERCHHYRIHDCDFHSSLVPAYDWTIHAILMQGCDDWDVFDIRTKYAQLKLGGGAGAKRGRCRRVRAEHSRNYAVSLVLGLGAEPRVIEDCVIEAVEVLGHCAGGVYLGNDQLSDTGTFRRVRLQDVNVQGPTSRWGRGVLLVLCAETDDVEIADVATDHTYYPDYPGVENPNGIGLAIDAGKDGRGRGNNIRIRNVKQRGASMYIGAEIRGPIEGLVVEGLDCEAGRRYGAYYGSITGTECGCVGTREDLERNGFTVDMPEAA